MYEDFFKNLLEFKLEEFLGLLNGQVTSEGDIDILTMPHTWQYFSYFEHYHVFKNESASYNICSWTDPVVLPYTQQSKQYLQGEF